MKYATSVFEGPASPLAISATKVEEAAPMSGRYQRRRGSKYRRTRLVKHARNKERGSRATGQAAVMGILLFSPFLESVLFFSSCPPTMPYDPSLQSAAFPHRTMANSPAPPLPNINPSASSTALQPGSIVNPPLPSGNVTPLGAPGQGGRGGGQGDRGPDYVYFERKPAQFGETIAQKSTAAKMRLELYYKETVEGVVGRKER